MTTDNKRKRTHQERIETMFSFMENQPNVFPKSQFKEIGLNPHTAETWLKLIEFIQNQPRIRLIQTEHNLLVEKVEGKYQSMMLKLGLDEAIPFEQRMQYLTDYLKSLYAREKSLETSTESPLKNSIAHVAFNPQKIVSQITESLDIFSIIDPSFNVYNQIFKTMNDPPSNEDFFIALSKWQKDVLLSKEFQLKIKQILNPEFYGPHLGKVSRDDPEFMEKLMKAKQTIQAYYAYLRENLAEWFFNESI